MSQFDPTDYFSRAAANLNAAGNSGETQDKFDAVIQAKRRATEALTLKALQIETRKAEIKESSKDSLVTTLGLDPDSAAGIGTNLVASAYSGLSRVAGDIAGFAAGDLEAIIRDANLSEEQISAVGRYKQGKASPEDLAIINARKFQGSASPLEMFDKAAEARTRSADINQAFDRSGTVYTGRRAELSNQLGDGFSKPWEQVKAGAAAVSDGDLSGSADLASGLAKLVYNAGEAAVTNPGAAAEYIAENAPQLAIGAFGTVGKAALLASNAGYASENYQKGIQKYQAENGGAYPPAEERQRMALFAASTALAEQVTDTSLLKAAGGAADAVKATGKAGFMKSLENTAKAVMKGVVSEAATEGYQTFAEGEASLTPASPEQIYEGAVVGGLAGGGMAGGGRALGELLKVTPEDLAAQAAAQTRREAREAAVASGDVTALVDPKQSTYDPAGAVAALSGNSALPTATEDTRKANLEKASEIVATVQADRDKVQAEYDSISPEGQKENERLLAEAKAKLAAETDPAKAKQWQEDVDLFTEQVQSAPKVDKKQLEAVQAKLKAADQRLGEVSTALTRFNEDLSIEDAAKDGDLNTQVSIINTPIDENDQVAVSARSAAATKVINLSMAVPENLTTEVAESLASNMNNGLTSAQRTYLREFTAARVAENNLKTTEKVSQEIYLGSSENLGIVQHRQRIAAALASGNQRLADTNLALLQKFEEDHRTKAELVAQAFKDHQATGKNAQVIRVGNAWQRNTGKLLQWGKSSPAEKNGAFTIHMNTPVEFGTAFTSEAAAITAALNEMKAAYAVKFGNQGATNVPVVPQALDPAQDAGNANPQVPASTSARSPAGNTPAATPAARVAPEPAAAPASVPASPAPVTEQTQSTAETSVDSQVSTDTAGVVELQSTEETQVAEQTEGEPQSNDGTTEATDAGKLEALSTPSPEGTAYGLRNIIADYFTQSSNRDGDATKRPLVHMKSFLSQGWDSVMQYLTADKLSEAQLDALRSFWSSAEEWSETIQRNLFRKKSREYWVVDDLMQFFIIEDEKGKLDLEENVKTALSYAAYSWIADNAGKSKFNTDEEINAILGRDEDHAVENHERDALLNVGTRRNLVINSMGQRAIQALGLSAKNNAPIDLMPKLESAMGAHVFKLLMDQGVLEQNTISAQEMAQLMGNEDTDSTAVHNFLKLAQDSEGNWHPKAEAIIKANRGTQGVLAKLFSVEASLKEPTTKPVKFVQKKTRNTRQDVPSKLAKIVNKDNAEASYVRQDMFDLASNLDEVILLQIAGGVSASKEDAHAFNRLRNEAKNDGLLREIRNFKEFVQGLVSNDGELSQPIFFEHSVWKQQRVGISTNMVNPQTSKVHRHMLFRKSWETVVKRDDPASMENFQLRVLEGLGVKTDKQSNEKSLQAYEKKVGDLAIQAAVKVLQKRMAGQDLSQEDQEALLAGVKVGGENMKSLDSLMALAHEANNPGKDFTVQLVGEVDGVTNGPMLSHLLMGAAETVEDLFSLLNRGGFFERGNEHNQYNLWRGAAGHFDLYETTAGHMVQSVQSMVDGGVFNREGKQVMKPETVGLVMGAIYSFTGLLAEKDGTVLKAGRNIIKTPLTAMVFGSSVGSAVESMANNFVESIYAGIEATSRGEPNSVPVDRIISSVNLLLSQGRAPGISSNLTIEQLMELQFTTEQMTGLKRVFKNTVGAAVAKTMNTDFASFIEQRRQFNLAAQVTFELYDAVYQARREEMIAKLVESGEIAVNKKTGKPLHDLTPAQESELRKSLADMAPIMHTLMSKDSKQLNAGLYMSKSKKKLSTKNEFQGEVQFGRPLPNGTKSVTTRGFETVEEAPGVGMAPMSIHSLDSAISHYAAALGEVLNIHDAHGAGLGTFEETARNLNQATWNAVLNYSPAGEMHAALSRTVMGFAKLVQEGKLPKSALTKLDEAINKIAQKQDMDPATLVSSMLASMKAAAYKADSTKLDALAQAQSFDQYALEGGNYVITDKDRADASARRAGLSDALTKEEEAAAEAIDEAIGNLYKKEKEERKLATEAKTPLEEDPPPVKPNPFGEVGQPIMAFDRDLVEFFSKTPITTAGETLRFLYKQLSGGKTRTDAFQLELVKKLMKIVPTDLRVEMITPETDPSRLLVPTQPSLGWYTPQAKYRGVSLMGPQFVNSGLTLDVVLHELIHASVFEVVESDPNNPFVKELEQLLALSRAYVKQNKVTGIGNALENVHELIAWGMTNPQFQRSVLNNLAMQTSTGGLVNGFKAFIEMLVGIVFKGSSKTKDEIALNGMSILIANVSGLMAQAENAKPGFTSSGDQVLSMAVDPISGLMTYSTMDIYDALNAGTVSPEFDSSLKNIIVSITDKLHGPFGSFKAAQMKNQALTAVDAWKKALATGGAPFASSVLVSPLQVSEQEAFVMEQIEAAVLASLSSPESATSSASRELNKLFTEALSIVKPSDFATQAEYDFLFKVELDAQGRSDYLARFAAFGLGHEQVNKLLQKGTALRQRQVKKTLAEKLQATWDDLLEFFHEKITKTYSGQRADAKLLRLVDQLVDIEAKKRLKIAQAATQKDFLAPIEEGTKSLIEAGVKKIVDLTNTNMIKNSSKPAVRAAGALVRTVAENRVDQFLEGFAELRAMQWKERLGFLGGTLNYALNGSKVHEALLRARKVTEGARKDIITNRSKLVLQAFANNGKDLTPKASKSITQVFLRTGMHVLTGQFSLAELENMMGNQAALDKEIAALEAQLTGFGAFKEHFINQANALGYFKVTGKNRAEMLMMNAHNIARAYGTNRAGSLSAAQVAQAEPIIEKLVALYAMGYTEPTDLAEARKVLQTENARNDGGGNGVAVVLALHKRLEQESKDRLFKGQEALMMHGYTSEIYNPHIEILTANEQDGKALERRGYKKGGPVAADPADPDKTKKHLYVLEGGGLMPHLTGSISYTGRNAKGTKQHSGYMNVNTADGLANAVLHANIMNARSWSLATGPRQDLRKAARSYMAPVVNPQGAIVNWRYMMQDQTKDSVLDRENRFNLVLGTMAGSIYDKDTATEINTRVFEAMKDQYDAEKGIKSHHYVMIGPKSPDAEAREIWAMLPDESKAEARRIWGRDGMFVRNDHRDIIFGYRKLSIADAVKNTQKRRQENADRIARGMAPIRAQGFLEQFEEAMATMLTVAVEHALILHARTKGYSDPEEYGQRAAVKLARGEAMWQELVSETKDLIVIKTVTVMAGNLKSNLSLLVLSGVPLKDIVKNHLVSWRGATSYQRDSNELDRLQTLLDIGQTNGRDVEIKRQIARLQDALARNPVRELIEAGLMPTIVEDAAADEDVYSYKSQLVKNVDDLTSKLHPGVKTAAKNIYMAKDTKVYQTLRQITQLSDFMARYTQYQYLTTRKNNPLSKEDAIQQSSDDFINYDIPMQRGMQYLDDMGIMPFMKYYLRVQKVIHRLVKENPARVLSAVLLGNFVNFGPIVLDSSWTHRIGNNPLHWGAFQYPGALDELATVDAALSLVGANTGPSAAAIAAMN